MFWFGWFIEFKIYNLAIRVRFVHLQFYMTHIYGHVLNLELNLEYYYYYWFIFVFLAMF